MPEDKLALPSKPDKSQRYKNHAYFNADGTVDGEKLLAIVNNAPGAFDLIMLEAMIRDRGEPSEYDGIAGEIVRGLLNIILRALYNVDNEAAVQLRAIEKLVAPGKYEIPQSAIRDIALRYETSPPLARGWELRQLMSYLAGIVEPAKAGKSLTMHEPIKVMQNVPKYSAGLQELANKHWKRNSTLQSLAIRIYLEGLRDAGITNDTQTISEETLKRDLKLVREWEETHSYDDKLKRGHYTGYPLGDTAITWCGFSEGWKMRRKGKSIRGSKTAQELTEGKN
jgi:hypothetical protein